MSLLGSLEELGLGELLQIISMSRKSGLLSLQTAGGEGWILLEDGEVRGAHAKGAPADLRELLLSAGVIDEPTYERAVSTAREQGLGVDEVLVQGGALAATRLEELRREHVAGAVLGMCAWTEGEFRLQRADLRAIGDPALLVERGLPAQILALEHARRCDEAEVSGVRQAPPEPSPEPAGGTQNVGSPVVVVDPDLLILEWVRGALDDGVGRLHVFQRPEQGVDRIRQYLARGEVPVVLLAPNLPPDPLTGARNAQAMVRRLKSVTPRLRVLWLERRRLRSGRWKRSPAPADGQLQKPTRGVLSDPSRHSEVLAMGEALRAALVRGDPGAAVVAQDDPGRARSAGR